MQCRVHRRTHRSPRSARGCEHATPRTVPLGDRGVRGICMNIGRGSLAPELWSALVHFPPPYLCTLYSLKL